MKNSFKNVIVSDSSADAATKCCASSVEEVAHLARIAISKEQKHRSIKILYNVR